MNDAIVVLNFRETPPVTPVTPINLRRMKNTGVRLHVPELWGTAISQWLIYLRAGGIRQDTLDTYRQRLERTSRHIRIEDPWAVTRAELLDYFGRADWDIETRRGHRTSLRSFYGWAAEDDLIAKSPATALPKIRPKEPNPMPAPDSAYLPAVAAATEREGLMLELAAEHGMRRGEVVLTNTATDLVEDLLGWSLVVHGKGGKTRIVPLLDDTAHRLRALPRGWVFAGRIDGHMSPKWCGKLINRLLPDAWTIHKLRHRAATEWWEASEHDLLLVARLLGHSSTETTQRYVMDRSTRDRDVVNAARTAVEQRQRRRLPRAA